ncbi:MAG: hypothetical protein ACJAVK_000286 [Akkermansiaceae bacterium]
MVYQDVLEKCAYPGFPGRPFFMGEDLRLGDIREDQFALLIVVVLNTVVGGVVLF